MDIDDWEQMDRDRRARNLRAFEKTFNEQMRAYGDPRTLDDVMGIPRTEEAPPPPPPSAEADEVMDVIQDLVSETEDSSPQVATLRALRTYRTMVRHVKNGGTIRFYDEDGETHKTLKIRVK